MSQNSLHGKWTVSSSDDDDEVLPPSGTATSKSRRPAESSHVSSGSPSPVREPAPPEVKAEPDSAPVSALAVGSEARQLAARNQRNPVKFQTSPSLSGKRKKEPSDGSGWALSDSDDEDDAEGKSNSRSKLPNRAAPNGEAKKPKKESERPPSPHGRLYYTDEPDDFFEASFPCLNDTYRFYLNKVTGLDRKFNSGALHIRGEAAESKSDRKEFTHHSSSCLIVWLLAGLNQS